VVRLAIGGDSRDDLSGVVPWAFAAVKKRGAKAFFFLGDLELTPAEDQLFLQKLGDLRPVAFYPLMGNHEIETFGFLRLWRRESRSRVKEFKEKFVKAPGMLADDRLGKLNTTPFIAVKGMQRTAYYLAQWWFRNRKTSAAQTAAPK